MTPAYFGLPDEATSVLYRGPFYRSPDAAPAWSRLCPLLQVEYERCPPTMAPSINWMELREGVEASPLIAPAT
jgi:hypothetical protein